MKNYELLSLVNAGILDITANELDAAHAYKVLKFKRAVKSSFDKLAEEELSLLREAGIHDPAAFDKERKELSESGINPERLAELDATMARFAALRDNLYKEEAQLDGVKAIPFSQFHLLQKENKELRNKPLNAFEILLEGILWSETDNEEKE